ncbi:MAG: LysM peptidoglycan-binding domain-containing protein [Candidatus Cloacimonas sp.]|jgi:murein DD-endopeptidase MepM/ murein hydrolase activator NlpD|nr:LysM peptidoglycan-binding domain-containing protein [Candidatus Cloacimonas sp.]
MILKLNRFIWLVVLQIMLIIPAILPAAQQVHSVRKGDTLYNLSKKYGTTVDQLMKLNKLQSNNLSIGQKIIISNEKAATPPKAEPPAKPAVKPPPPVSTPGATVSPPAVETPDVNPAPKEVLPPPTSMTEDYYYTIKAKDNLYRVALNNGISLPELLEWNGFADVSVQIHPGDRLIIKNPSGRAPIEEPKKPVIKTPWPVVPAKADTVVIERVYIVQKKDTMFRIATNNGMTVEELMKLNNMSSNDLKVGQRIYLAGTPRPASSIKPTPLLTEEEVEKRDKIRTDLIMPAESKVISEYGLRNGRPHKGIDLGAKQGTPIYAVLNGTVVYSGVQGAYGNVVVIEHPDFVMTVYGHNEKNMVSVGDVVKQGQQIATVGSTGNAQGSHVHFEYRLKGKAINPRKVLPLK